MTPISREEIDFLNMFDNQIGITTGTEDEITCADQLLPRDTK